MRKLPLVGAMALACTACATSQAPRTAPAAPEPATAVRDEVLAETVASQVVQRDGMTCVQGLDSYGNVVEEHCTVADAAP
ncbi:hypothetical protein [Vulgatibacter sp.]|uniref:hypothetical protein n=1 Tax=Vulgatibacter sp. TaxID=1971226 RepID=UPI003563BD77